jgi:hypothetical protein
MENCVWKRRKKGAESKTNTLKHKEVEQRRQE